MGLYKILLVHDGKKNREGVKEVINKLGIQCVCVLMSQDDIGLFYDFKEYPSVRFIGALDVANETSTSLCKSVISRLDNFLSKEIEYL